jgi:nitroimidazol reductase NimA-like FMN-containing flavoprotein (pyridoxamine 5'-phosphate oxidase superfamily)
MRRKERSIEDPDEIRRILSQGRLIYIALCRSHEPYIVTMNYGFDRERNALYVHCAKEGLKIEFIRDNPRACATVVKDLGYRQGRCEQAYRSLVLRGTMHIAETPEEKKHGLDVLLEHQEENPDPIKRRLHENEDRYEKLVVLRLDIEEITGKAGE